MFLMLLDASSLLPPNKSATDFDFPVPILPILGSLKAVFMLACWNFCAA
jgi:hypothetical protein